MSRLQPGLVLVVALASLVAACAGGDGDALPAGPTVDPAYILGSGLAEPSPRQLEMIADGEVTFEEYEEAFFAYYQCRLDAGMRVRQEPQLDVHGIKYEASFFMGSTTEELEENTLKAETCMERHLLSVLPLWSRATQPSEALLQEATEAVKSCLAAEQIEVPTHLSLDDFAILLEAAASGHVELVPSGLSLGDLEALLEAAPDAGVLFMTYIACRDEAAQQYPVGW